ncbi:MAG: Very short patch repair protein [Phycisphaerae bacterium]|nr:Very short patch repair protein [Phycisphaerae bacterium]
MADVFTPEERSAIMRAVRSTDTKPEMIVRRLVHSMGYRYRLHVKSLPGCPDLVFPKYRAVIFVHGCYWHRHNCREGRSMPASNTDYWQVKFARNRRRDACVRRNLRRLGWKVLVLWECQTRNAATLKERIQRLFAS